MSQNLFQTLAAADLLYLLAVRSQVAQEGRYQASDDVEEPEQ